MKTSIKYQVQVLYIVSTKADCNRVAQWLRNKGINALEYHTSHLMIKQNKVY